MTRSRGGAPPQNPAATTRPAKVDTAERSRQPGYGEQFMAEHRRRHAAALRLPPLGRCGCRRDPLFDKHRHADRLTDHQLDGWLAAITHLAGLGIPAVVPTIVRRALRERAA